MISRHLRRVAVHAATLLLLAPVASGPAHAVAPTVDLDQLLVTVASPQLSLPGAQAASAMLPATTPAVLIKSRRERYASLGVISDERTGMDL